MRKATGMCRARPGPAVQPQKRRASPPPRGPQPPRTPRDAGGKGKRPRKKRSLKWQLIKVLLVLILLAGAGVYGYIWKIQSDVRPYLNVFLDNVSVDGIDLSGLTWAEGSPAGLGPCEPEAKWLVCAPAQHQRAIQGHYRPDAGHLF